MPLLSLFRSLLKLYPSSNREAARNSENVSFHQLCRVAIVTVWYNSDMEQIDETALNVLLAEGMDVPTAYVAATITDEPQPRPRNSGRQIGMAIGLAIGILYVAYRLI